MPKISEYTEVTPGDNDHVPLVQSGVTRKAKVSTLRGAPGGGTAASQSEVNTGTEAAKFVVPATLVGREGTRFAARTVSGSTAGHQIDRIRFGGIVGIDTLTGTWLDRSGAKEWKWTVGAADFTASTGPHAGKKCVDTTMSIGYNGTTGNPNEEVQISFSMEARYLNDWSDTSSEYIWAWKSKDLGGGNHVNLRPMQINVAHWDSYNSIGTPIPYETTCIMNFDRLWIIGAASRTPTTTGGTSVQGPSLKIETKAGTADWSTIHQQLGPVTYNGPQFTGGGGSMFGPYLKSWRGYPVFVGTCSGSDPAPPGFTTQNVFYTDGGGAWTGTGQAFADAVLNFRCDAPSGGETAIQFFRTADGQELMRLGSHANNTTGGIFKTNPWQGFYLDLQTTGARRQLRTRFSLDNGVSFTQTTAFSEKGLYIGGDSGGGSMGFTGGSNLLGIEDGSAPTDNPSGLTLYSSSKVLKAKDNVGRTITYGRYTGTKSVDFGSIAAGASATDTITVTGAATGAAVTLGLPTNAPEGIVYTAWVSATDTVTVRATNVTGSPIDPPSGTFRASVHIT